MKQHNPFAQSAHYQSLTIYCEQHTVEAIESTLEDIILSTAAFEHYDAALKPMDIHVTPHKLTGEVWGEDLHPDAHHPWRIDMVLEDHAARHDAETRLQLLKKSGLKITEWHWQDLEMRDWVAEIQKQFPPLSIGRFYIHGSHLPALPKPRISLEINAGRAFGTGEHATTSGCLLAMEALAKHTTPKHILDLGCGTGILAIAAKKLWPHAEIIGTDLDAVSIEVAKKNARDNEVPDIRFYTAAGYHCPALQGKKFDLILANILARPLIKLSGLTHYHLKDGGYAVLSGLLNSQALQVLHAYRSQQMKLLHHLPQGDWAALTLQKPYDAKKQHVNLFISSCTN